MISNSGHDERGKYSGGKAGDQTGGEWAIIDWYNRPWNCILRHPNKTVRETIAVMGEKAASNNNIGYDQGERATYWGELVAANYNPAAIKRPCEADCSSGVLSNVKATGYKLNIASLKNINHNGYTGNMKAILKAAGFQVLTDSKYLTSDRYLLRGDILLYEGHHTATNLTNGSSSGESTTSTTNTNSSNKNGNVAIGQKWLNSNYGSLIKKHCGKLLAVDNSYGNASKAATLCVWKDLTNRKFSTKLTPSNSNFGSSCKAAAKNVIIKRGSSGTYAYLIQFILAAKGFYFGKMDGDFGGGTENSVISFQRSRNLSDDGVVGANTWFQLFN